MNLLKKLPLVAMVFGLAVIGLTSAFKVASTNSGTLTELYGNLDGTGWVSLDGYTESNSGAPGTYTCNDENPHEERPCTACMTAWVSLIQVRSKALATLPLYL